MCITIGRYEDSLMTLRMTRQGEKSPEANGNQPANKMSIFLTAHKKRTASAVRFFISEIWGLELPVHSHIPLPFLMPVSAEFMEQQEL